jgi:hypothetical protein
MLGGAIPGVDNLRRLRFSEQAAMRRAGNPQNRQKLEGISSPALNLPFFICLETGDEQPFFVSASRDSWRQSTG